MLAILLAIMSDIAASAEADGPPDDGVDWAEMKDFLPGSATLEECVGKIRRAGMVTSDAVGYGGSASPVYVAYTCMRRLASDAELRALLADRAPAVRVYAYGALSDRLSDAQAYELLFARVGDIERVPTLDGCIYDRHTVFERMLRRVEYRLSLPKSRELRERHEQLKPAEPQRRGFF